MNLTNTVLKLAAAAAAVAGIAFLVYKNIDKITAWLEKLCPCKCVPEVEEEPVAQETDFVEEASVEEAPVEETPVEEAAEIPEGEPVAEEDDFAE